MKKLGRETIQLNRHNTDVTDALRQLQLDNTISQVELRAAIDEIIAMVTPLSIEGSL